MLYVSLLPFFPFSPSLHFFHFTFMLGLQYDVKYHIVISLKCSVKMHIVVVGGGGVHSSSILGYIFCICILGYITF